MYLFVVYLLFVSLSTSCIQASGLNSKAEQENYELNVREDASNNYFKTLSLFKQREMLVTELYNRKHLGIQKLSDEALNALRTCRKAGTDDLIKME